MKTILAVVLVLITASAHADDKKYSVFNKNTWTPADTAVEVCYLALHIADWGQTRNASNKENAGLYVEQNRVLGKHPSIKRIDTYFTVTALAHIAITYALPRKWRDAFQYSTILGEAVVVFKNDSINLKIDF
ncbi:MAG: hypothetical protein A2Z03_09710 [Chloroflexi bacterium RBG_16_56_8]|nr:MAG: hypothetical protein A2Z03_09710 [Chloroflexi bacterium RBG_16_56_8]